VTAKPPARIRVGNSGVSFRVRLTPKGGRDAIEGWEAASDGSSHLKARVRAAPEGGKANAALTQLIAATLRVPRGAVDISGGEKARLKTIVVAGDTSALVARLEECGAAT
jgi:uncharacterized protein YggU (UPF0235/DUF167 family)